MFLADWGPGFSIPDSDPPCGVYEDMQSTEEALIKHRLRNQMSESGKLNSPSFPLHDATENPSNEASPEILKKQVDMLLHQRILLKEEGVKALERIRVLEREVWRLEKLLKLAHDAEKRVTSLSAVYYQLFVTYRDHSEAYRDHLRRNGIPLPYVED